MIDDDPIGPSAAPSRPFAWQPLTLRGVAAFAHATLGRLLLVEFLVASLAAGAVFWFLSNAWFPAVRQAIQQLPEQGAIHHQELDSSLAQTLAENRFILFVLDTENRRSPSSTPDVVVEFHKSNFHVCSILGCLIFDYPKGAVVEFNRPKLAPLWGAWEPTLLGLAALGVFALLLADWILLATFYSFVVRLLGFFKDRDLSWRSSWQLASAALMPGALLLTAGIFFYGLGKLGLIRLLVLFLLHFVVGWIYVAISPVFVPRLPTLPPRGVNPFAESGPKSIENPGPNTDNRGSG